MDIIENENVPEGTGYVLYDTDLGQFRPVSESLYNQVHALERKTKQRHALLTHKYRDAHPTKRHRSRRRKK